MNNLLKHINILRGTSNELTEIIFKNEEDFNNEFIQEKIGAEEITDITFYEYGVKFTYLGFHGNHVVCHITWTQFIYWLDKIELKD